MTREVELMSRLNHKNVVRYYGSWTEVTSEAGTSTATSSTDEDYESDGIVQITSKNTSGELSDGSSSGGIVFQNPSNYEITENDKSDDSNVLMQKEKGSGDSAKGYTLCIQMELCEDKTLRTEIDSGLYKDKERLWRYFRSIIEGLTHIHQQGIIHRDLKPVNIFLDSRDQIKIGDFGLAISTQQGPANQSIQPQLTFGDLKTDEVGTPPYKPPESADAKLLSVKWDIYSAGIIFFEMISPPLNTGSEFIRNLKDLRTDKTSIPMQEKRLLKCLLDHDLNKRPTAEELLESELMEPSELDAVESKEIIRNVQQEQQQTCHQSVLWHQPIFENVKSKIVKILSKRGAIEVEMRNLRQPYRSPEGVPFLQRYSIGQTIHYQSFFNLFPNELVFTFEITASKLGAQSTDAEAIKIINEIINEFKTIKSKNVCFRINQTSMLRALFIFHQVPTDKYKRLQNIVSKYFAEKTSMLNTRNAINALVPGSDQLADTLLMSDIPMSTELWMKSPIFENLKEGSGECTKVTNAVLRDLKKFIELCQFMGVTIPINLCVGLSTNFDCRRPGCIIWQLMTQMRPGSLTSLASGGRSFNSIENTK